ncbi:MAG TPA: HAMP domain-containing sensor histidine kinase [Acidimicrobiia bacterium]|nr:HAMP domain-containing sensor histidine kinase [Acidimicrobiia bacterium]
MNIRFRITVVAAAAMAGLAIAVAGLAYYAQYRDLRSQVDVDLRNRAAAVAEELEEAGPVDVLLNPPFGSPIAYAQVVDENAAIVSLAPDSRQLPVDEETLDVARGMRDEFYSSTAVDSVHLRMLTIPLAGGRALQVARPVDEIDLHLLHYAAIMGVDAAVGIVLALVLGGLIARSALRPVERLTAAAEKVAKTRDLAHRIEVKGDTELDRLASSMNSMVAALDEAIRTQNQLVADASHELQTPLTVLHTNVEFLERGSDMSDTDRARVLADLRSELQNLSRLVNNLVQLARRSPDPSDRQTVLLDEVLADVIAWGQRAFPDVTFSAEIEPFEIEADPDQVEGMVRNLVQNAATWTAPGASVDITLCSGTLTVRDHGPGIDPSKHANRSQRF